MKISYQWLKELVALRTTPQELAEKLTMAGLAVDSVEEHGGDFILDFDLTSNRPDALSHFGIAREAAIVCGGRLISPLVELSESSETAESAAGIQIAEPTLCPRYAARLIKGVKVGSSPKWLVDRLEAIGQRSVNNIADISNYVMFEMGQPTHAFDLHTLKGRRIIVRRAQPGEILRTLDGVDRTLSPEMLVIADAERAVAVAGVMGGEETEISSATTDVLLESAYFDPDSVRHTSRELGLTTEASYRFERGADFDAAVRAADRASRLIAEIAGGVVLQGVLDEYSAPITRTPVPLREARIERLAGLKVEIERAAEILTALEFKVELLKERYELLALPPSFRIDVSREEDLVEEVARHIGYEKIALTVPEWSGTGAYLAGETIRRGLRRELLSSGFDEAISFSFAAGERDRLFRSSETDTPTITNPIDANETAMRGSLITRLLESIQGNFNKGTKDVKLFEIGRVFGRVAADGRPQERERLALIMTGMAEPGSWREKQQIDFFDLKGAVRSVMQSLNVSGFTIERASVEYLHPGQSAALIKDGRQVAMFGRLHPRIAALYKFRQAVFVAELELGELLETAGHQIRYRGLPRFPASSRDVSALVQDDVSWRDIEETISDLGFGEIESVNVFDVYAGRGIPEGSRSLAFRITYRSQDATLTDEQVNLMQEKVKEALEGRLKIQLR